MPRHAMDATITLPEPQPWSPLAGPTIHGHTSYARLVSLIAPAAHTYSTNSTQTSHSPPTTPGSETSASSMSLSASWSTPYKHTYPSSYLNSGYTMATPTTVKALKASIPPIPNDAWKAYKNLFLAMPPEIHVEIFKRLNPIDAVCLSLVKYTPLLRPLIHMTPPPFFNSLESRLTPHSPYIHHIYLTILPQPTISNLPLTTGSPSSALPLPLARDRSCKHCVPVLYYPAHCELHYHIRSFIPRHLQFCSGPCKRYTHYETKGFSDSREHCGKCGVNYARRYQRGRRMIDVQRPGEKQVRLNKWYNGVE